MFVLVVNCGSSSIKFQLWDAGTQVVASRGIVARIGEDGSYVEVHAANGTTARHELPIASHAEGFEAMLNGLLDRDSGGPLPAIAEVSAVGHRAVHGGDSFVESVLVTDEVIAKLEEYVPLAPLHNPASLMGIREARRLLPGVPQVAVFDTAFHQTMPPRAFTYALPGRYRSDHHVRRYGFHGTSYRYVCGRTAAILARPLADLRVIACHLGNGCSMVAVDRGRAIDTTMGLTPTEGLVMGTRSGDLDPGAVLFLLRLALSATDVEHLLNHESGLLGISGVSNDMRVITQRAAEGDERCELALDIFTYRAKKYVGAYAAAMGGVDALVFTGGIGENSPVVRRLTCRGLAFLGIEVDDRANDAALGVEADVSVPGSPVRVLVIPTDEERVIALDTIALAAGASTASGLRR
ncbi:MAG: acetate kinase [Dehalococcoidia bacterium]